MRHLLGGNDKAYLETNQLSRTRTPKKGDIMLDFPGKPVIVCSAVLLLSLVATASSLADPRSARPTPPGQDTSSGATTNTTPGSPQTSEPQASIGGNSSTASAGNSSWTGGDGRLETSIPLNGAWSLELGGGIDSEQQSRSNSGDVNGRVGFGFRF